MPPSSLDEGAIHGTPRAMVSWPRELPGVHHQIERVSQRRGVHSASGSRDDQAVIPPTPASSSSAAIKRESGVRFTRRIVVARVRARLATAG